MISLQTADNVLKSYYLDAVKDTLDNKTSPLLAMIERTSENVYGKDVKKVIRVGVSGGIVAGTETGNLPSAESSTCLQLTATLKNLYGTIEISDKAIRAAQGNEGAFVNILNAEMEHLLDSAKYNLSRMAMGANNAKVSYGQKKGTTTVSLDNPSGMQVGMRVRLKFTNEQFMEEYSRKVLEVNYSTGIVTLDGDDIPVAKDEGLIVYVPADADELTGVRSVFTVDNIYGLTDEQFKMVAPIDQCLDEYITLEKIQEILDRVEEASGSLPNLIICSWGIRRSIMKHCADRGVTLPVVELASGHKALSFNGVPIVVDRFCNKGEMYFLNTNDIKMYQLGDWEWMESDDGKILHQVPGRPVYTATLVKYAEIVFERMNAVARLTDVYEE